MLLEKETSSGSEVRQLKTTMHARRIRYVHQNIPGRVLLRVFAVLQGNSNTTLEGGRVDAWMGVGPVRNVRIL